MVILVGVFVDEFWPDIMLTTLEDEGVLDSEEKSIEKKKERIEYMH